MVGLPPRAVLGQRGIGVGSDLGTQRRLGSRRDGAGTAGPRAILDITTLPYPLPPTTQRALTDAKAAFDLSRGQPGILGRQQPFTEISGVLLSHARSVPSGHFFRNPR